MKEREERKTKTKKSGRTRRKKREKLRKKGLDFSNKVEFCLALEDYQVLEASFCFFKPTLIFPSFMSEY